MAVIAQDSQKAEVRAQGEALNATVNFSGALMEMLATVYVYILMAAVREAIQNACDAARRAGLSVSEGVMVRLPTAENPVFTVTDKGSGMTKEFMESADGYLSFGTSTKSGDNGSAGGLGVGRWAAYGYIRECYISTCHASDMVQRTYFQFQSDNQTPSVQLAQEIPGSVVGTRVYFPVKDADLAECYRAVAWLKEVMQLTMGDSFSVDAPALLPKMLPPASETVLELGDYDSHLKGIRVYPMRGTQLNYGRQGLADGSLVVLTNKEAKVGGLPFHVKNQTSVDSIWTNGCIVDIPMSYNIPFMPSREEVKYTDDTNALFRRIDSAAKAAALARIEALHTDTSLHSKRLLHGLLGTRDVWNVFSRASAGSGELSEAMRKTLGGYPWKGSVNVCAPAGMTAADFEGVSLRYAQGQYSTDTSQKQMYCATAGNFAISDGKGGADYVRFKPNLPAILVYDDLKANGATRYRAWLETERKKISGPKPSVIYISAKGNVAKAKAIADGINANFNNELTVHKTSDFPEEIRVVVGSKVVTKRISRAGQVAYFSTESSKQEMETMDIGDPATPAGSKFVFIEKSGGRLGGFNAGVTLGDLTQYSYRAEPEGLSAILRALGATRLYLLTPKQAKDLQEAKAELMESHKDLFDDLPNGEEIKAEMAAYEAWISLEDAIAQLLTQDDYQDLLKGNKTRRVVTCHEMTALTKMLGAAPRLCLVGTKFDKAVTSLVDVVSGESKIQPESLNREGFSRVCDALIKIGTHLSEDKDTPQAKKELKATLLRIAEVGVADYRKQYQALVAEFPMLRQMKLESPSKDNQASFDHFFQAMAIMYK